ncbi:DUF2339 domain-containing protein [Sulfitobacter donghicola]|uniref:DUF2339 domain-containing protein n=1 Tax=Sulfitobacter donghicola DSW-25 = KCTC 12864 = JCM 14565 TaxID=1300350 RepID=A0A073IF66_9RHOB|nr:DUF2339 domain-containing protein [Sulfitobacter donghicola]KEJ88210.1 hypothetical protein DSW25_16170 [Sulfitobacter donghicola DSW-25 = KCTC 12864 = JCM 14565]KIN68803.1 putative membrane protein [Sulfitobacter donghicola DSW-25 = KCTC 12864 = JCM 14565]
MDGIIATVVIIALAIPIAIISLIVGHGNLRKRISDSEFEIKKLQSKLNALDELYRRQKSPKPSEAQAVDGEPAQEADKPQEELQAEEAVTLAEAAPEKVIKAKDPVTSSVPKVPPAIKTPKVAETPTAFDQTMGRFGAWLQQNWFYAVSAASLALAGIFLVQYGMENGLLPPKARVAAGLAFGAALIGVGEFIRRRFGDDVQSTTAYLPSVFSGAGIVTLFGAILSARMLYDLIGGGASMVGMVAVALLAVVLGWLHGPLLVAVGVIGAYGAPFMLADSQADASPLFGYFAVVAALGLAVDTIRRWGWISALTLMLAYGMGFLIVLGGSAAQWSGQLYFAILPMLAILIPARSLSPDHAGPPAVLGLLDRATLGAKDRGVAWPSFPTLLAFTSVAASCFILLTIWKTGEAELWLSMGLLAVMGVLLISWSDKAPALQDAALLPPIALLLSVFAQSENASETYRNFLRTYSENPEADFPWVITILVAIGVGISILGLWRALRGGQFAVPWAAFACVYAPAMAIVLEMGWQPADVIGAYPWALHAAALAATMSLFAERLARRDAEQRLRVSFAMMSALSCMSFAFVIVLSSVALTVALAVTVVAAAALDRLWKLPTLGIYIAVGVVTVGYRLVVDPGLRFGIDGPLPSVLLAYGGSLAAFLAALWLLRPLVRPTAQVMLDSAVWSTAGLTISLLLLRWIENAIGVSYMDTHWSFGLHAAIWMGLALAQVQRADAGTSKILTKLRWGLAALFGVFGGGALFAALTAGNPLLNKSLPNQVFGPVLVNTLAAAYLVPAAVLLLGAWRLTQIDRRLRVAFATIGGSVAVIWALMVIRHFWQGGLSMSLRYGISQPEQYTYTIVLLVAGAGLFYQSLARRSPMLRKAGLVVIGLAVAKVFLIDISDLDGLTRIFSLLVLGLSLAGLAWLNRWAQERDREEGGAPPPPSPPALPDEDQDSLAP